MFHGERKQGPKVSKQGDVEEWVWCGPGSTWEREGKGEEGRAMGWGEGAEKKGAGPCTEQVGGQIKATFKDSDVCVQKTFPNVKPDRHRLGTEANIAHLWSGEKSIFVSNRICTHEAEDKGALLWRTDRPSLTAEHPCSSTGRPTALWALFQWNSPALPWEAWV